MAGSDGSTRGPSVRPRRRSDSLEARTHIGTLVARGKGYRGIWRVLGVPLDDWGEPRLDEPADILLIRTPDYASALLTLTYELWWQGGGVIKDNNHNIVKEVDPDAPVSV